MEGRKEDIPDYKQRHPASHHIPHWWKKLSKGLEIAKLTMQGIRVEERQVKAWSRQHQNRLRIQGPESTKPGRIQGTGSTIPGLVPERTWAFRVPVLAGESLSVCPGVEQHFLPRH